jgi:Fe2+ transport system protein FeoA
MTTAHVSAPVAVLGLPPLAPARTLADVRPGESVRVTSVAVGVHDLLADLGVRSGTRVRCDSAASYLIVRTGSGRVPLERGLAAAVQVVALTDASDVGC